MSFRSVILCLLLLLLGAPVVSIFVGGQLLDPYTPDPTLAYSPPGPDAWAGRDTLGRDYLARLLLGAGQSVLASSLAAATAFVTAILIGVAAGWREKSWTDRFLGYFKSLLFTVPFFLIAVAVGTVIHAGLYGIYLVVGLAMWAPAARIVRAESIRVRGAPNAIAARAYGFTNAQLVRRVFLPQVSLAPAVSILYLMPELLGLDVGLSFFGLGATPPDPTLGRLVFDGIAAFPSAWWLLLFPGLLLVGICLLCYVLLHAIPTVRA